MQLLYVLIGLNISAINFNNSHFFLVVGEPIVLEFILQKAETMVLFHIRAYIWA